MCTVTALSTRQKFWHDACAGTCPQPGAHYQPRTCLAICSPALRPLTFVFRCTRQPRSFTTLSTLLSSANGSLWSSECCLPQPAAATASPAIKLSPCGTCDNFVPHQLSPIPPSPAAPQICQGVRRRRRLHWVGSLCGPGGCVTKWHHPAAAAGAHTGPAERQPACRGTGLLLIKHRSHCGSGGGRRGGMPG